jgi:hypothetical protein
MTLSKKDAGKRIGKVKLVNGPLKSEARAGIAFVWNLAKYAAGCQQGEPA